MAVSQQLVSSGDKSAIDEHSLRAIGDPGRRNLFDRAWVTNVIDGFNRLLPFDWRSAWRSSKEAYRKGYNAPTHVPVPKRLLKREIDRLTGELAAREQELAAALAAGQNSQPIRGQVEELRETLRTATEQYERRLIESD